MSTGFTSTTHLNIESHESFAGILSQQEKFATGSGDGIDERVNSWFDRLMVQSGLTIGPAMLLAISLLCGTALGGAVLLFQENPLTAAMLFGLGTYAPVLITVIIRGRRQRKMMAQLPAMIDELARAAKTGRSIEQCWDMVAADTPAPLGGELTHCARRMKMGEDLPQAVSDLPYRTGLVTLNILVTALTVHQQTGGDLVSVLERLSQTIRDRLLFLGRLRAATIGSRATAILMLALPPGIVLFFSLVEPDYFPRLMASEWGRYVTMAATAFEIIGTLVILKILQTSQRS